MVYTHKPLGILVVFIGNFGESSPMGIVKRPNSKYWYVQFRMDGKHYIRSSKTTDKRVAEQLEAKWRTEIVRSEYLGVKDRITLEDACNALVETKRHLVTYRFIKLHRKTLLEYISGSAYIDTLQSKDAFRLVSAMKARGYASETIRHIQGFLKRTLEHAGKLGYQIQVLSYPTLPIHKGRLRYLTHDEEKRLLQTLDPYREIPTQPSYPLRGRQYNRWQHDHFDLVIILLDTGARFSEIATLEWESISIPDRTIRLWRSKVRNESVLYMTDRVLEVIRRRFAERSTRYLFNDSKGGCLKYTAAMWQRIFKRAGLEGVSCHTLRHTHATRLIQNGMSIYEVKEVLGHADIKTTMRYSHLERTDITRRAKDLINGLNSPRSHHSIHTTLEISA